MALDLPLRLGSIQVLHVQLALLTEKCSGPVGLTVGVHYVCSPQGGSQHKVTVMILIVHRLLNKLRVIIKLFEFPRRIIS